ncbi:MAG: MBL fold metallo-hydrolase [Candidatus Brocadiia bacterium]
MKISMLTVGPLESNCYLAADDACQDGIIIDPGAEGQRIAEEFERLDLQPGKIINTHAHADHICANGFLKAEYPDAELCIGKKDADILQDSFRNLTGMFGGCEKIPEPDRLLTEGDKIEFGSSFIRVLDTPGHTPGGICLVGDQEQPIVIFCGDVIFAGGVGRTDLPGGNWDQLRQSIEKLMEEFPEDTILLPGHGRRTTLKCEKDTLGLS